jgi:transcriptional regulator with XRE-family HTH domain
MLALRLRELREHCWADTKITQAQLARALGQDRPISVPLISSWESLTNPRVPPPQRLEAYATFFATPRSLQDPSSPRLLADDELDESERSARSRLSNELLRMRAAAFRVAGPAAEDDVIESLNSGYWKFDDGRPITIVCARLPQRMLDKIEYSEPSNPDYVALYAYADLDAFVELHGHIRASNPGSLVQFRTADQLVADDYTTHLVALGGIDWNIATESLLEELDLPIVQVADWDTPQGQYFEVRAGDTPERYRPTVTQSGKGKVLREDIALFARAVNPFNRLRTATICSGMYAAGTFGAVRALTDERFRDRNANFARKTVGNGDAFCILTKVQVQRGTPITPDWTIPDNRLFEWKRQL